MLWLQNFISVTLIVAISLLIREFGHKVVARFYNSSTEYRIWSIKRLGFQEKDRLPKKFFGFTITSIPIGIILPILFAFISLGKIPFAITGTFTVIVNTIHRVGRKYIRLTEREEAKIALAGPLTTIIFAIFLKFLSYIFIINPEKAITITLFIAIFNMLPFPNTDGGRIFFGSKGLYVFNLAFILLCALLLQKIGLIPTIILAITLASIITINYTVIRYKS